MSEIREAKVEKVANYISNQIIEGDSNSDTLVVSWGGTYGVVLTAVEELLEDGKPIAMAHFKHIKPLPKNTAEIFKQFKKIIVVEINLGQFVNYLRMSLPDFSYRQYNKIQGLPFSVAELKKEFRALLKE